MIFHASKISLNAMPAIDVSEAQWGQKISRKVGKFKL